MDATPPLELTLATRADMIADARRIVDAARAQGAGPRLRATMRSDSRSDDQDYASGSN